MTTTAPAPRGNLPLGILLGVVVGAIAVMLAWFGLVGDPDSATPAPAASGTPSASATTEPSPTASVTPTATSTPEASASPTAEASPTPTPDPTASTPAGIVTELPVGSWITVLDSLPQASVTAEQALARASALTYPGHETIVIDTTSFTGLNPGYWAVVIPGADSRAASNEVCRAIGISVGNHCYPREIKA